MLVPAFLRDALAAPAMAGPSPYGALGAADVNGLELPAGFTSRRIAVAGQAIGPRGYVLPPYPDGEATFKTADGGWILVTNSESAAAVGGGTSAIRFSADGTITDAYRILGGTSSNCAGGPTPWGTWLSGEELSRGLIWECDPAGKLPAQSRPACGAFAHEAAAIDPVNRRAFLTEDDPAGGFYRLSPTNYPYLTAGTLQCAEIAVDNSVIWHVVPDPTTTMTGTATRLQVPQMTKFAGAEGIWYANGVCYFTTKGDKKVWAYDIATNKIEVLYDHSVFPASLDAVDNVTVSAFGDVYVCEDGGNLEIGLITPTRLVSPFLRFTGAAHASSEVCGVVFNPSQQRLYCTSQRAEIVSGTLHGAIYEITGPSASRRPASPPTSRTVRLRASARQGPSSPPVRHRHRLPRSCPRPRRHPQPRTRGGRA